MSDIAMGWALIAVLLGISVLFVCAWNMLPKRPESFDVSSSPPHKAEPPKRRKKDTMLGFKDRQLGWVFVAGGVALFLFVLSQEKFFDYQNGERFIAALASPVVLYAIMRAFETGKRSKGEGE